MSYVVRHAKRVGRGHLIEFKNCQDALKVYDGQVDDRSVVIGFICDGCSEGEANEVGANLGVNFLIRRTLELLQSGLPIKSIPSVLYPDLVRFLRSVLSNYKFVDISDQVRFINDYLLFTVIGLIVDDSDGVIMVAGDGVFEVNGVATFIESDNKPQYPAYNLIDRRNMSPTAAQTPNSFDVYQLDRSALEKVAIGSDAWQQEKDLLVEIWGDFNGAGLQRLVNRYSNEKHFRDDVSIITVRVVREATEDDDGRAD